ncbi:MAG: dihydrofolate reductase [Coprobacter sp.]|nr:dihydrofolate reductase [Coprobacter sp.]
MPVITMIAAVAANGAIGKDNDLLCHLPNDLKHFKALTLDHTVVMGRRTFESLPGGALPRRRNVVLTSAPASMPSTVEACTSWQEVEQGAEPDEELIIMGGATLYRQMIERAQRMYITEIHHEFPEADVFFPEIDKSQWREVAREDFRPDERHAYPYSFVTYERV